MKCFISVGWMWSNSLPLITFIGSKITSDIELRVANLKQKLSICDIYPVLTRQYVVCIVAGIGVISIDKCRFNNRLEYFGNASVRQMVSQRTAIACDLTLNSNYFQA